MWKYIFILCVFLTTALSAEVKVLAFSGSTREASFNKKLIQEATLLATEMGAEVTLIDLRDFPMPFYDGDLEETEGMPASAVELRKLIHEHQIIMIASPNYNGSFSGVLKNALDWASRNEQGGEARAVLEGKKLVLMSASTGKTGGIKGLPHLRKVLENLRGKVIATEIGIPYADKAFDENGKLIDATLQKDLEALIREALID